MRLFFFMAIGLLALVLGSQTSHAADRIEWRLENPFRLFKKPEHTDLHRLAYENLGFTEQNAPILSVERRLASRSGGRGWAEPVFNHTCYDQDGDRYTACQDYVLPKSHRIIARLADQPRFWDFFERNLSNSPRCRWLLQRLDGVVLDRRTAGCSDFASFDIPYPQGAKLTVSRLGANRSLSETIKIEDVLIVGLGDSFGAGEGNPDDPVHFNDERTKSYGTIELAATGDDLDLTGYPVRRGNWRDAGDPGFRAERARWWDRECHRSLYSHQLRAALQLAIEEPQRAITFLGFSCSGAEILQGLLIETPVRECSPEEPGVVPGQISALSRELCVSSQSARMPSAILQRLPEIRQFSASSRRIRRCSRSSGPRPRPVLKRPIDMIFLSAGGNDVGFVPIVADSILNERSIYRRLGTRFNSVYGVDEARKRLALLEKRVQALKFALDFLLGARDAQVIYTGYPNMGYAADGMQACGGTQGMEVFPAFRLDPEKVGAADAFSQELNRALAAFSGGNWTYVDGFISDFRPRGLCATSGRSAAEALSLPIFDDGVWQPYAPSLYQAYAERQRWFRTPNDAFMTSHMHALTISAFGANCSRLYTGALRTLARRHWKPFQLFLASTYGGAFHPTAEGQARIADEIVKAARASLARRK